MQTQLHFAPTEQTPAFVIPLALDSLAEFRAWTLSPAFPETGRIDFVAGKIEVDMSPERFFAHGQLKHTLIVSLSLIVDDEDRGYLCHDVTRVVDEAAGLSVEPDVVFLSHDSLESGRVSRTAAAGDPEDFVEIVGGPDLIVEILSNSSVAKDTKRLPPAYFAAGVQEFWLADGRGETTHLEIQTRGASAFEPVPIEGDGFQFSPVLGKYFRLECTPGGRVAGSKRFRLLQRD